MILEGLLYRLMPGIFGSTEGTVAASTTWPMSALSSPVQRTTGPSGGGRTPGSNNQRENYQMFRKVLSRPWPLSLVGQESPSGHTLLKALLLSSVNTGDLASLPQLAMTSC